MSMKKEENIVAAEEDLVVGGTGNIFSFEEMKRTTQRNRMFSTNKIKQDIELENLKTGREELMLEQSELWKEGLHSTKMMKEGLQESKMMEGMEEPNTLKGWQAGASGQPDRFFPVFFFDYLPNRHLSDI